MRKFILPLLVALPFITRAQVQQTIAFPLPDSVKGTQFYADISMTSVPAKKEAHAGIRTDLVQLALEADGKDREVSFQFPATATIVANGIGIEKEKGELEWDYNWSLHTTYKLLLAIASDSADNFTLYSGYIWLPEITKWKLIGTCRINGRWGAIKEPALFHTMKNKKHLSQLTPQTNQAWLQRTSGSWKSLRGDAATPPVVNLASHADSLQQHTIDLEYIKQAIASGKTDAKHVTEDVYYIMMKEGTGRQVALTDTVVVNYKGSLLSDGSVFDQTKDKPATFPLNRLIRGWHIGVPLCKVGGKIKIVIPSALAYSIRTRAAKIPPNSILVFEVEVLDTKPKQ